MLTKKQISLIKRKISEDDDRVPIILGILGDLNRYRIFKILRNYRKICVTDIASILGITVSATSQQLRVLERIGLVRKKRVGQMICYETQSNDPLTKYLSKLIGRID